MRHCIFSFVFLFVFVQTTEAQTILTFTKDTDWVAPAGATKVFVECWGAGCSGGINGNGGGGGAFASGFILVTPGERYAVTVAETAVRRRTTFHYFIWADSGYLDGNGGQSARCRGTTVFSGGNGGSKLGNSCGGGGGGASQAGPGANGANGNGLVGGAGGGNGSQGQDATNKLLPGGFPAGGSGGGLNGSPSGGGGMVRLTF